MNELISLKPIGLIHTPFDNVKEMPIQASKATGIEGTIEIFQEFVEGLKDINGFSHIILLYFFHLAKATFLTVTPFLDTKPHGIFATRAPLRPNHIGISVVKLREVKKNILYVENLDIVNNTPLFDIKPYIPEFDNHPADKIGWLSEKAVMNATFKSDNRFDVDLKSVRITIDKHCIETHAKREYENLLSQCLKKSTSDQERERMENSIEILRFFLQKADFAYLRSNYPKLRGENNTRVNVTISYDMLLVDDSQKIDL